MSEISESYHLATSDRHDAVSLLERSGREGWVVGEGGGWVTFVVGGRGSRDADPAVVAANDGLLLRFVNLEDEGCWFSLFDGPELVGALACTWENEIEVHPSEGPSVWRGHGTSVEAQVDPRGRVTVVSLTSPARPVPGE